MVDLVMCIVFPLLYLYSFFNQYKVFQAYHYELKRYFKHNWRKILFVEGINIVILIKSIFVSYIDKIVLVILSVILTNSILYEKGELKITNRVKRSLILYVLICFISTFLFPNKIMLYVLAGTLIFIYLFFTHTVSCLLENIIMANYVKDAKRIIKNKTVIGITGSYGKTSCKNIIFDMLNSMVNVSKTPKSFNNKVGIVKSIRECVNEEDECFICEYGVDKKGGMDKLLKVVKPNISLITEIGPQHILTFKNIENIKNEKIKLAEILLENEFAVINNDNIYLNREIDKLNCKVVTYGINSDSYIMANNIIMNSRGSSFDLYIGGKKYKNIKICLLGEHNVLNVLGSIGVLMCMNLDISEIVKLVKYVKPVEHRLESKILHGVKIIDDGYNSNEVGFKNAIDVLNLMVEKKFVITPGIIEQGSNSEVVNYELGKYMADKIDFAILVEKNANNLKKGLLDNGFDEENILIKKDFMEAWDFVKEIADDNKIFLIENDLPSIYLK